MHRGGLCAAVKEVSVDIPGEQLNKDGDPCCTPVFGGTWLVQHQVLTNCEARVAWKGTMCKVSFSVRTIEGVAMHVLNCNKNSSHIIQASLCQYSLFGWAAVKV